MNTKAIKMDSDVYDKFSAYCAEYGLSITEQMNKMIKKQIKEEPKVKKSYLAKLDMIKKEKGMIFNTIEELDEYITNAANRNKAKTK